MPAGQRCSIKMVLLKKNHKIHRKTPELYKRETPAQVFSCKDFGLGKKDD